MKRTVIFVIMFFCEKLYSVEQFEERNRKQDVLAWGEGLVMDQSEQDFCFDTSLLEGGCSVPEQRDIELPVLKDPKQERIGLLERRVEHLSTLLESLQATVSYLQGSVDVLMGACTDVFSNSEEGEAVEPVPEQYDTYEDLTVFKHVPACLQVRLRRSSSAPHLDGTLSGSY